MANALTPEQKYRDVFDGMLKDGKRLDEINSNHLHVGAGGRYSRAADFLDKFKSEYREKQERQQRAPDQPEWFRQFVIDLVSQTRNLADSKWITLSEESNKQTAALTEGFKQSITELKERQTSDRNQIHQLEDSLENVSEALEQSQNQNRLTIKERDEMKVRLSESRSSALTLEDKLDASMENKTALDSALKSAESDNKKQAGVIQELRLRLEQCQAESVKHQTNADSLLVDRDALKAEKDKVSGLYHETVSDLALVKQAKATADKEIIRIQQAGKELSAQLNSDLKAGKKDIMSLSGELGTLKQDNKTLLQKAARLEGELGALKTKQV